VPTPFGYWPEKCVNRNLEKGTLVVEHEDRVEFVTRDNKIKTIYHD